MDRVLHVHLLGGFHVWSSHSRIAKPWQHKPATLIKLLALSPGYALHRDHLQETLWPRLVDGAARNNLHHTLHSARQTLALPASEFLFSKGEQVVLAPPDRLHVDVDDFFAAVAKARRVATTDAYGQALMCYPGDLLPEDQHQDWLVPHRERLGTIFLELFVELARLYETQGDLTAALLTLRRALEQEPTLEEAAKQVMRLQLRLGQGVGAVRTYKRLRVALDEEIEVEPDEESQALYQRAVVLCQKREQLGVEKPDPTARVTQDPGDDTPALRGERNAGGRPAKDSPPRAGPTATPGAELAAERDDPDRTEPAPLSPSEKEVARLVAEEWNNQEIADKLLIGPRTAETLVRRILRKLNARSRHQVASKLEGQNRDSR